VQGVFTRRVAAKEVLDLTKPVPIRVIRGFETAGFRFIVACTLLTS